MSKVNWEVTDYGLEYGSYAIEAPMLMQVYNGIYGTIEHVIEKGWPGHQDAQFVACWRKGMARHGYRIKEALFEETIRSIAYERAESFVRGIYEHLDDELHDPFSLHLPWRVMSVKKARLKRERVGPIVSRVMHRSATRGHALMNAI